MAILTFAAIDIGTYEVSMKIFELSKKIGLHELNFVRHRLEIGKKAYSIGKLGQETVDELCDVLDGFSQIMKEFDVQNHRVCATSAFREVKNPMIIIEQIYQRTGFRIEVLSSAEQHFLGYKSIAALESGFKKMLQKGTAILDVGGGGIQVSLFEKESLVATQNLKMGSVRIRERLKSLETSTIHYDQLVEEFIRNDLTNFQRMYLGNRKVENVILLGDFLRDNIFREKFSGDIIEKKEFMNKYETVISMSSYDLAQKMDLDEEFASLIVPTMVIYRQFIQIFGAETLWAPGVSLIDGMAYDFGERMKLIKSAHKFEQDILVASRNISKRYQTDDHHIQGTTKIALTIFDSMKKIHGMGARERLLLQIAVQLHDCGKYISLGEVAENSYRIIMATEVIGLSTEERRIIANAVRYNSTEFIYYDKMDYESGVDKKNYLAAAKLTAILRLANAMDRSHYQKVENLKVQLKDRELHIVIDSTRDFSLEMGLLKDKVEFFEEVYGIHLVLRRKRKM